VSIKLKVAIYVVGAYCHPDFMEAISGHVQVPLMTANILIECGHDVTIITTKYSAERVMPAMVSSKVKVHTVLNASRAWPKRGVRFVDATRQIWNIHQYLKKEHFDIIHFIGFRRTCFLAGLIKKMGLSTPVLLTSHSVDTLKHEAIIWKRLGKTVDRFMALTGYTQRYLTSLGIQDVALTRPGIIKNLSSTATSHSKNLVLFWRNANARNGADLCIEAFKKLTSRYPNIDFVFAVRPWDDMEKEVISVGLQYKNIHTYIYPYTDAGVTLESLLQSAICAVFPFRNLSINPQFAILETMAAGCPVVATNLQANNEIVQNGETGILVPPDNAECLIKSIDYFLVDPSRARRVGRLGALRISERWNWANYQQQILLAYKNVLDRTEE